MASCSNWWPILAFLGIHLVVFTFGYQVVEWRQSPAHPLGSTRHVCDRVCVEGEEPMTCNYDFTVEVYSVLGRACYDCPTNITDCFRPHCVSAEGTERAIIAINRMMPGPPVVVCKGDHVVVDVKNHLAAEVTSFHFHGEHFRGQQYMDGTPYVTQCPIIPATKFRYSFMASTSGTLFWHSHTMFQRGDGHHGPYVVRQSEKDDPHADLYDYDLTEHVIVAQEWFHAANREAFTLHHWDSGSNKPDTILINGRGRMHDYPVEKSNRAYLKTPLATFHVSSGRRYRFRVISPGFTLCPLLFSIDSHNLTIIASDTSSVTPQEVKSFVFHNGERYDFVLTADQKPGIYLIRLGGLLDCGKTRGHGAAFLIYDRMLSDEEVSLMDIGDENPYESFINVPGLRLNAINYAPVDESDVDEDKMTVAQLQTVEEWKRSESRKTPKSLDCEEDCFERPKALQDNPDKTFYLGYDFMNKNNPWFHHEEYYSFDQVKVPRSTPMINNISLMLPSSPLLSQGGGPGFKHCNEFTVTDLDCNGEDFCECTHMLEVDIGDVVEMWFIDQGIAFDVSHPFHVHGTDFYVVAMERHALNSSFTGPAPFEGNWILKETVKRMNEDGQVRKNLLNPPLKDTVTVPDSGFTVIRFVADNLGYWLIHCHMSWHNHIGMALVLKVGDVEKNISSPPKGFPKCGDFEG